VRTGPGASAQLVYFEGTVVEVQASTGLLVQRLERSPEGNLVTRLFQSAGSTLSRVTQLADPAAQFEIETPAATALVRGTELVVQERSAAADGAERFLFQNVTDPPGGNPVDVCGGPGVAFLPPGTPTPVPAPGGVGTCRTIRGGEETLATAGQGPGQVVPAGTTAQQQQQQQQQAQQRQAQQQAQALAAAQSQAAQAGAAQAAAAQAAGALFAALATAAQNSTSPPPTNTGTATPAQNSVAWAVFSTTSGPATLFCGSVTAGQATVVCTGATAGNALTGSAVVVVVGPGLTAQQALAQVRAGGPTGPPCATQVGQVCVVAGQVTGTGLIVSSTSWTLTAPVPAGGSGTVTGLVSGPGAPALTPTGSPTPATSTPTSTASPTSSATPTPTRTPVATTTGTSTPTTTVPPTPTATGTPSATATPTASATATTSATATPTPTTTSTPTATATATVTSTPTVTPTPTRTPIPCVPSGTQCHADFPPRTTAATILAGACTATSDCLTFTSSGSNFTVNGMITQFCCVFVNVQVVDSTGTPVGSVDVFCGINSCNDDRPVETDVFPQLGGTAVIDFPR
jgi:hypothetical protein